MMLNDICDENKMNSWVRRSSLYAGLQMLIQWLLFHRLMRWAQDRYLFRTTASFALKSSRPQSHSTVAIATARSALRSEQPPIIPKLSMKNHPRSQLSRTRHSQDLRKHRLNTCPMWVPVFYFVNGGFVGHLHERKKREHMKTFIKKLQAKDMWH